MRNAKQHIELAYIVPVYLDNQKCGILENLIRKYEQYSNDLLDKIHFIFVDDCSPVHIQISTQNLNYTLVRIEDNIPWNQPGARNLGVFLAYAPKLILTDLDHYFPETTLKHIIARNIPADIWLFKRLRNQKKIHSHPCTFFLSKSTFYKSLGFDEEFSGNYGHDDIFFLDLQKSLKTKIRKIRRHHVIVEEYKERSDKDHTLVRDDSHNKKLLEEKRKYLATDNIFHSQSRIHINFKWHQVSQNLRQ